MIYSVWNQGLGAWDYFECPKAQAKLNVEKPRHLVSRTLGSTPDQAAWPLPGNIRKIGSGREAVGRVAASRRAGALGASDEPSVTMIALLVGSAFLLWKYVVKAPRRAA